MALRSARDALSRVFYQRCFYLFLLLLTLVTTVYLLHYVFQPEVMTSDKLFGAASGYLMLGVLFAYFYMLLGYATPNAFVVGGQPATPDFYEAIYFSFTVLTSTGFGDMTPLTRPARSLVVVEQLVGALFIAILIARLAGVYPPRRRESDER